jgi:hypothetical protein
MEKLGLGYEVYEGELGLSKEELTFLKSIKVI